jgi:hypothetical protein
LETDQARRFVAAFASFGVFALAYSQLGNAITLALPYNVPKSMAETIEVLVVLIFIFSNMIMLIRSMSIKRIDPNRTIILSMLVGVVALSMMFAAKIIDSRYVIEFEFIENGETKNVILIRSPWLSNAARRSVNMATGDQPNFIENRTIFNHIEGNISEFPSRYDPIVMDNGYVAFLYAFFIAASKALVLFSFSMLTWALVLLMPKSVGGGGESGSTISIVDQFKAFIRR